MCLCVSVPVRYQQYINAAYVCYRGCICRTIRIKISPKTIKNFEVEPNPLCLRLDFVFSRFFFLVYLKSEQRYQCISLDLLAIRTILLSIWSYSIYFSLCLSVSSFCERCLFLQINFQR